MMFLQKERSFPFWSVMGKEGCKPSTPWFVATCSNSLNYRLHLVSIGYVPRNTLKRNHSCP
ncbi:hypothetical protein NC652_041354 [Populus alba x Populus x berolinensis]|nr:hypothetical protein NC652_041354 [Populus alba x Populus x berolinensis]